jgi:hypothetical protein
MAQANDAKAAPADDASALGVAPLWLQPLRWAAVLFVYIYYHLAYRVRGWGKFPHRRGPALIVANHQHDLESAVIVATLSLNSWSWRYPLFTASSRRMWEPGFFAERIPWLRFALQRSNYGWLFASLGMQPVENELHARPFASLAHWLSLLHGNLALPDVFKESALARLPPSMQTLQEFEEPRRFELGRTRVTLSELREPYRSEALAETRAQLDADFAHFARLVRAGATIFLTPEGFYSGDGRMHRLRGLLATLLPFATRIWLAGVSYDPFVGRRLSMMYRVVVARDGVPLEPQIKACRPVTTSALLGTWLQSRSEPFSASEALGAVRVALEALPPALFVDPELRHHPERMARSALAGLQRTGTLRLNAGLYTLTEQRSHPQFPLTRDMIEYQRNFHEETLDGARSMR